MTKRLEALSREGWMEFFGLKNPRCPHCGAEADIGERDLYHLCEEGEHEVECEGCDLDFTVSTRVSHTFSTDNQGL